jgi:hypothetical protein
MLETLKADDRTAEPDSCTTPFLLSDLEPGKRDKLGNTVQEILWLGAQYAIYRSDKGIYVHFSDSPEKEKDQTRRFAEICPELCELRYLTIQMRGWSWPWSSGDHKHTLYEHNMAQALMLMMEDNSELAKKIAQESLAMAVRRVTTDNTIRYVRACFICGGVCIALGLLGLLCLNYFGYAEATRWRPYVVGGMFGAIGAIFSIVTRLQAFKLKPCDGSRMNYWMSTIRVVMGVISAIALLLFIDTLFGDVVLSKLAGSADIKHITDTVDVNTKNVVLWQAVAVLGFIGGFAERLIPNILRQTIDKMESTVGTPVQAAREQPNQIN